MAISANLVKELREKTGAGMMECKKALQESSGNMEDAITILRKRGSASADKKAMRATSEGCISSYIHAGGKIGVLVEVNCETDFVAKTEDFQNLLKEIGMQIAASSPRFISKEDVTDDVLRKEKEIYREQIIASGKSGPVVEKILEGKIVKFYDDACLMEQPYIRDQNMRVKDLVKSIIAKLGENIKIRRFARFVLGDRNSQALCEGK